MKVFIQEDHEELSYGIEPIESASSYSRRYGRVYEVPGRLVRRHARLIKQLEQLHQELGEIYHRGGEPSPYREEEIERAVPKPRFSTYQLRREDTGEVLVELTTPEGASWTYDLPHGAEPLGACQWYARHMGDEDFSELGEVIEYGLA